MNDPETTEHFFDLAKEVLGEQGVALQAKPIMAGEDFAFYQQQFPGTFFFLGSGSEACDARWDWHHPQYNVDEKALLTGAAMMSALAFRG
jgi:metal-dependent amidase/aminoacylase/carboxypeptidase family protein